MQAKLSNIFIGICIVVFIINGNNSCFAQTGNYVTNGSFEEFYSCYNPNHIGVAKSWRNIDSSLFGSTLFYSTCYPNVPLGPFTWQWPKTGNNFCLAGLLCQPPYCIPSYSRAYLRNRLKHNLVSGKIYCVSFFVNISNNSQYGIDRFGAYFGDDTIDTITVVSTPLIYLNPQVQNPNNNIITDTLNWTLITGTFVANGTEKHLIIGNFKSDAATNKLQIDTTYSPHVFTDVCIDDVSCIEINLPAYAGPNRSIALGDSTYIGRELDFAIDPGCIWYKLPNTTTAIDTISGLWVKPTSTSTYVVKQTLDCSPEKWDTVVVYLNMVGVDKLKLISSDLSLSPNPAQDQVQLKFSQEAINGFNFLSIYNSIGQLVKKEELIFVNKETIIDTRELENGVYIISLSNSQEENIIKKLVITK